MDSRYASDVAKRIVTRQAQSPVIQGFCHSTLHLPRRQGYAIEAVFWVFKHNLHAPGGRMMGSPRFDL